MKINFWNIQIFKQRQPTLHKLHEKFGKRILATNGIVVLVSATFEVVIIPTLDVKEVYRNEIQ